MQRSRKALLRRRVSGKSMLSSKVLYQFSLSLAIFVWAVAFLLNLWISHGSGFLEGSNVSVAEFEEHKRRENSAIQVSYTENTSISEFNLDIDSDNYENNLSGSSNLINEDSSLTPEGSKTFHAVDVNTCEVLNEDHQLYSGKDAKKENIGVPSQMASEKGMQRADRVNRAKPPALDDFKSKIHNSRGDATFSQVGGIIHRVEPGGKEYNYASSGKGAKVLESNKEAKGASNILDKDKDKYLRNPCSTEDKYVVIELSEETLVDTVEIANFEHHSSNVKDFELLSSLVYPTDNWVKLGNFSAENVKHAQRFAFPDPNWSRYIRLNLVSHYGSEFYCTLSSVEIYGVDAVERMLEDLISNQDGQFVAEEKNAKQVSPDATDDNDHLYRKLLSEIEPESVSQKPSKNNIPDPIANVRPQQAGRMPGDTVLKILMQKVRSLDLSFCDIERYLEEINSRYGDIFKDLDKEIAEKDLLLNQFQSELKDLIRDKTVLVNDIDELRSWQSLVSSHLDQLVKDSALLRSEIERVRNDQLILENKQLAVIFISFIFGSLAVSKLLIGLLSSVISLGNCDCKLWNQTSSAWLLLLLCSSIVMLILI